MNDTLVILVSGLVAALAWGVSDYLAARSAKNVGPTLASLIVNAGGALLFVVVYLAFFREQPIRNISGVWFSVASGISLALGGFVFFHGLEKGPVSIVSPLSSLYPLITTLMAIIIFGAKLSIGQTIGIMLIIVGVLAASDLLSAKKSERKIASGPTYGLLAALFWGIGYSLLSQGVVLLGWQTASMIEFLLIAVTFTVFTPFLKGKERINMTTIRTALKSKYVIGATVIQLIGVLAMSYGLSRETSSGAVVTALSACYPILTVFLALKHMKEKVVLIPLTGAFVGIVGVIVLTLT